MFSWLKGDPSKKIRKKLDESRQLAMRQQRNGDLRSYAETMAKVEALEDELVALNGSAPTSEHA